MLLKARKQSVVSEVAPAIAATHELFAKPEGDSGTASDSDTNDYNIELVGRFGGGQYAIDVYAGYAFVGEGTQIAIYDISNPANPAQVGKSSALPGIVKEIAVLGDFAYVIAGGELYIVRIANPGMPVVTGPYENLEGSAYDIALTADYAFVATGYGGLRILDLSTPAARAEIGFYVEDRESVFRVAVVDDLAYLLGSRNRVIDVSDPKDPSFMGWLNAPSGSAIAIAGNYAYVTVGGLYSSLTIIDISDPSSTQRKETISVSRATAVAVLGDYAFVSGSVINIADPASPSWASGYPGYQQHFQDLQIVDGYLYGVDEGLGVLDITEPSAPSEVSYLPVLDYMASIDVEDNVVYATGWESALHSINVTSKTSPYEPWSYYGDYPNSDRDMDVAVDEGLAYYTTNNVYYGSSAILHVLDVGNPDSFTSKVDYRIDEATEGLEATDGYVYVAGVDICSWVQHRADFECLICRP